MRVRQFVVCSTAALMVACGNVSVVNTGDSPPTSTPPPASPPMTRVDPNLVDAFAYYVVADGLKGYYFTTPSGKWRCAILPHEKAGCQAAATAQGMGITGAPDTVQTPDGQAVAPNAIVVGDEGDPGFTRVDPPGFSLTSGKAVVLDFTKTLAAAGFRCNVQESGVSCENETSHQGFTFSPAGYVPQYTPVPG